MSGRLASGARRLVRGLLALAWLSGAGAGAREVHLTLLCTTDLHGRVLPAVAAEPGDEAGSLLRCATRSRTCCCWTAAMCTRAPRRAG